MRVIILAAGEGKRLRPHTNDKPKCLVSINGAPLIYRQLSILENLGYEVILVAGWQSYQLKQFNVSMIENPKFSTTNMVSTLYCARKSLKGRLVISYGDIAYSPKILRSLDNCGADIATVVDLNWKEYWSKRSDNPLEDLETMRINDKNLITQLGAKPLSLDEIQGQYIGLTYLSSLGSQILMTTLQDCHRIGLVNKKPFEAAYLTDLIQEIITRGYEVKAVKTEQLWIEVDTVEDLESKVTVSRLDHIDTEITVTLEK
tara:strand:- start:1794 stop:2570 length:777 start_codon:yes stop_codon:yes gene_type:complete